MQGAVRGGSFTQSFPLFGYDHSKSKEPFEQKLELVLQLVTRDAIDIEGDWRTPLKGQHVYPLIAEGRLTTWVGVGGSLESVLRAVRYDLPLMLAIIGGDPRRFAPYVALDRKASGQAGRKPWEIGVHSPGYSAERDDRARRDLLPHLTKIRDRLGRDRGWPPVTEQVFENEIEDGPLYAGSPETVARKISDLVHLLGISRFQMTYSAGPMQHEDLMNSIELFGSKVIPLIRSHLS